MRMSRLRSSEMYVSCIAFFVFLCRKIHVYICPRCTDFFPLLYGYCWKSVVRCIVSRPSSRIRCVQINKWVYLHFTQRQRYCILILAGDRSKDPIVTIYRDTTQSVVAISSSTVAEQLLTVRPWPFHTNDIIDPTLASSICKYQSRGKEKT
jgi:hypothetical protein